MNFNCIVGIPVLGGGVFQGSDHFGINIDGSGFTRQRFSAGESSCRSVQLFCGTIMAGMP